MIVEEILEQLREYVAEKRNIVYNDMKYATEHNFEMEHMALQYKASVLTDIDTKIRLMFYNIKNKEQQ